jgi:GMP synthase (glutamine-hydrolysing)
MLASIGTPPAKGHIAVHVHFVVHESFEAPGAYENWVRDHKYTSAYSRVYAREPLPQSVEVIDLLVVFGGPQSPSTTTDECPHFDAAAERALISKCVAAGKAVVGICLGSQLIGETLGAKYDKSPEREIGKFPITLTTEGKANDKFADFSDTLSVGHWHNDMPGLTKDATIIAYSEGCPRQIVEYSNLVYGFQCHMEFTNEVIELLIAASEREFAAMTGYRFVQQPDALRANEYDSMNKTLFGFLDKLVAAYRKARTASENRAAPSATSNLVMTPIRANQ